MVSILYEETDFCDSSVMCAVLDTEALSNPTINIRVICAVMKLDYNRDECDLLHNVRDTKISDVSDTTFNLSSYWLHKLLYAGVFLLYYSWT